MGGGADEATVNQTVNQLNLEAGNDVTNLQSGASGTINGGLGADEINTTLGEVNSDLVGGNNGVVDGVSYTSFEEINICVAYELDGKVIDYFPSSSEEQARIKPVFEKFDGWDNSTFGARLWNDLPAEAIKYVKRIEELTGIPVSLLSTSPERDDTILVKDPFDD